MSHKSKQKESNKDIEKEIRKYQHPESNLDGRSRVDHWGFDPLLDALEEHHPEKKPTSQQHHACTL